MSKRRYFESDSKRKAGVISEDLRNALDLGTDQLPVWIYRMRVLGYPPGWLERAQVNTLSIFDGIGTGTSSEEGELNDSVQYNKESLIEYPGFNVAVPPGVRDDWYYRRMPPMLPQQQLKEALKTMRISEPVPYKKTRLETTPNNSPSTSSTITSTPKPSAQSSHPNSNQSSEDLSRIGSNESQTNDNSNEDSFSGNKLEDKSCEDKESTEDMLSNSLKTPNKSTDSTQDSRKLKLISMGSPMPATERPTRPSLEKWSEGMGELIYFENLPEYTGNYKNKMKGIIDKIREKTKN